MLNKPKILSIHNQFPSHVARKYGLYGGVGYYRQRMPAKYLKDYVFEHAGKQLLDIPAEQMETTVAKLVMDADLIYTKHVDNPYAVYTLLGACKYYNKPLIVDFDDDVFTTDGKSPDKFTYTEGLEQRHFVEVLLQEATAITVSTKPLVSVYEKYNTVHLLPNACDMSDWRWEKRKHERPTVGWAGSASHAVDHKVMEPVYGRVIEKHPDVVFSFVGHMLPEHLTGVMKRKNWELKPGISWWEGNPENDMTYPRLLAECGYDIGLAPLIHSQFNASRSLVKWFEYTMTGIPTIASNWGPYTELRNGEDAFIVNTVDEWVEKINHLLENPDDGKRLVANARERIAADFSIERTIGEWRSLCEKYVGRGFDKHPASR